MSTDMNANFKPEGLEALNARVARDLALLTLPSQRWVPDVLVDGEPLLDVAIIGAGMAGLAAAGALRNIGVAVRNFDARPRGLEGPWATTARMETLRSPKSLTGPALGIPSLTFRAWFEAQFGLAAWEALDKIPRLQWMDYLRWFRAVMDIDVRNEHRITKIHLRPDHVLLDMETPDGPLTLRARHVVLATGRDGLGGHRCHRWRTRCRPTAGRIRPMTMITTSCAESAWLWLARVPRPWTAPAPRWRRVRPVSIY
ncbi:FAD/NAD(P)-binding protein [Paracoccus suum]|uniref:FAD/NAD(P)-binding protein n=1 Tax=Paracoccus suum TaxID=2259340 RepID=UPI0018EFEED5|nr:FAD/NAD(P)-binding protein [Paracoccus suum]